MTDDVTPREAEQRPNPPPECLDDNNPSSVIIPANEGKPKNMFDYLDEVPAKKGFRKSVFQSRYIKFPHEWQEDPNGCGAAAFSMVYNALGRSVFQSVIFKSVAVPDVTTGKGFTCVTWLLYLDALKRGFHALHVQVINPIEMLKNCYENTIMAIIHERASPSSTVGHASVLIGIDDDYVYQHCPALGPNQAFAHNEVRERMLPFRVSDVGLGNSLTLISNATKERHTCKECDKEIPEFTECPNPSCGAQIRLSPSEPLGCIDPECYGHKWIDIMCPHCMQGIRRADDRKEASIPDEEWEQTKKDRQAEIEKRKNRYNFGLITSEQPKTTN